ncbi:P-loop containing nucleoside triphosphate hydrolase protein [Fimicolochytrium jonesii]|uniref:P-loop containing nucleoside triphosphate hydrolase protein n=1 Tax=Fimicolochytrium jonesii TaxID=1396493 RepID=UPI0022FF2681|nr:P-loop containing nucleoside triphosphate hydrolase protein [Fimicolochytrium jonesii]KAI8815731.1 P-loop containing nucleoside triphosphate hydrolase protein [Fimicolochytrium jonesii]
MSSARQTNLIRTLYLSSILRQSRSFFDTHNAGELSTRLTSDIELIQNGTGEKVGLFMQASCTLVAAIVIAFIQSWKVTLVLGCLFPFMGAINVVCNRWAAKNGIAALTAYAEANSVVEEALSAIRTLMSLNGQKRSSREFVNRLEPAEKLGVAKAKAQGLGLAGVQAFMYLAYSIAFFYGAYLIQQGQLTPGKLVAVYFALMIGTMRMSSVAPELAAFSNACAAAFAIFTLIDAEPQIAKPRSPTTPPTTIPTFNGAINFQNVTFTYPSRPTVKALDNFTLQIQPGKTTAFVGASGSGKSTIIALVERGYEPTEGTITASTTTELRDLDHAWWRNQIGIVSQEPSLFDMSIAENIALGAPEGSPPPTQQQIEEACKLANAHAFIEKLPEGYNTVVGDRGALMSGGQKQRICIARALVRNPKVLLLDEATSALDSNSERLVQSALERASLGRTTLVVAHRLSTVRTADTIVVMNQGKIVEIGDHNSLIEADGVYRKLVDMQQIGHEDEEGGPEGSEVSDEGIPASESQRTVTSAPHRRASTTTTEKRKSIDIKLHDTPTEKPSSDEAEEPTSPFKYLTRMASTLSGRSRTRQPTSDVELGQPAGKDEKPPTRFFRRLLMIHRPEWNLLALGVASAVLSGAIYPVYAIMYGYILEVFTLLDLDEMRREANRWAAGYIVVAVAAGLGNFGVSYLFGKIGERVTTRLRTLLFDAMLRQEVGWFDRDENRTGSLVSRIAIDTARVNVLVGTVMGTLVQLLVNVVGGLVVGFTASWKVTVVTMGLIPILIFAGAMQIASIKGFGAATQKAYQRAASVAVQAMQNHTTVQCLGREDTFLAKYNQALEEPIRASHRQAFFTGVGYAASNGLGFLGNALAFWWGGTLFADGEIDMRRMFTVMMATVFGSMAMGRASAFAGDISKAKFAGKEIIKIIDRKTLIDVTGHDNRPTADSNSPHSELRVPEMTEPKRIPASTLPTLHIAFKDIWFAYPTRPTQAVLRGLNLEIKPGTTVALVGASGNGKSTIVQLLERFYDVQKGQVLIDGVPLTSLDLEDWREQIGYVGQEPVLFDATILENIAYGSPKYRRAQQTQDAKLFDPTATPAERLAVAGISQEDIVRAAKDANIYDFVSRLPMGFETRVGNRGAHLSGGQKQRIAIARALIRHPRVLLLDEATSALDATSEKVVQEALDKAAKGRTTIAIAHRLSSIKAADCIYVFKEGMVAEQGTHLELIKMRGLYYQMVVQQDLGGGEM